MESMSQSGAAFSMRQPNAGTINRLPGSAAPATLRLKEGEADRLGEMRE
jgi:hypothetical protein